MTRWGLLLASGVFTALFLAWQALVAVNFLYPLWHQVLDIGDTVRIYGPQNNHNRRHFEDTTADEHTRLFAAIVQAVEHGDRGLETLRYRDPQGRPIDRLLTPPEIVHLQDVARLVGVMQAFGWACVVAFAALGVSLRLRPAPRPPMKKTLTLLAGGAVLTVAAIVTIGPKAVFYKVHSWIFPPGHQWFFHYQDSLMTTLMQAPNLFAGIAVEWLLLTAAIFFLLILLIRRLTAS